MSPSPSLTPRSCVPKAVRGRFLSGELQEEHGLTDTLGAGIENLDIKDAMDAGCAAQWRRASASGFGWRRCNGTELSISL